MRQGPVWSGFGEWLDACCENAVNVTLSCAQDDLLAARSMAAVLRQIREVFETAPEVFRETE